MYQLLEANPLTVFIVIAAMLVTPFYILATYVFSGASAKKGAQIGTGFLIFGAIMFVVCLTAVPDRLGDPGSLVVPAVWILPSLFLVWQRKWFLSHQLSQHWLIGLQIWRAIGGVFLLEMGPEKCAPIFAYPAGLGDLSVAVIALLVLLRYRNAGRIPARAIYLVIWVGVLDFIGAFFFGFFSSETPVQLFSHEAPNRVIYFPTGMIPLFLVPYAIFFHLLSGLNHAKFRRDG
ncbi:MAG: hypothetical protein AAGH89_19470 [Verrucomicrobiota bacterium]